MTELQSLLFSMRDEGYRCFQCGLMPTVDPQRVIGVRTPQLRAAAKRLKGSDAAKSFLQDLPHAYYEEDNLHAFLIEHLKDFEETVAELDRFLPYINNWATCDSLSPKVLAAHREELLPWIRRWMASEHPYAVRFGIELLMRHYLTDAFDPDYPRMVAEVTSEHYYVRMMVAWYFATALVFRFEECVGYLSGNVLSPWVRRKALQKALESRRFTDAQKARLRLLR